MAPSITLAVFARYPRLGEVKTRLAARLGETEALRLYEALLCDSLNRFRRVQVASRIVCFAGCSREEGKRYLMERERLDGFEVEIQQEGDLGVRLLAASAESWKRSGSILFVGSDSPTLPLAYLRRTLSELSRGAPVVLGPSCDGGYFLIGLSQPRPRLFQEVSWGSRAVFRETLDRAGAGEVLLLPFWYDVDQWDDLALLTRAVLASPASEYPALRPILAEGRTGRFVDRQAPEHLLSRL